METKPNESSFFILHKPKDIVSGDFYYALAHKTTTSENELFYICAADCTGHGVPGAFMSMLGVSSLNEAILEKNIAEPNEILNDVRNKIITSLNPEGSDEEAKDGMDCVLCAYDFENKMLHFAAANNPLWLVREEKLTAYKPDKMPVGKYGDTLKPFTSQTLGIQEGDVVYIFTDGFADQFGGPNGKKFKYKQLQEKLIEIHLLPMEEQKKILGDIFESWKGNHEQLDDVLVIGVKI
jgi:serine phosphatase RsbU (regulator of sigma subunit)